MKKSPFKITIFVITVLILILTLILCIYFNAFSIFNRLPFWENVKSFFENGYVINIITSIAVVIFMYFIQLAYCKQKIKKDFRCSEIIEDIQDGLNEANELIKKVIAFKLSNQNEESDKTKYLYHKFYLQNKESFYLSNLIFTYKNNDILISSIQSAFFINLNFKLLNIINNIKNRLPNIKNGYDSIKNFYDKALTEEDYEGNFQLDIEVKNFLVDLKFMVEYWQRLLDYLKYDPTLMKTYKNLFNQEHNTLQKRMAFFDSPTAEREKVHKRLMKLAKKQVRQQYWNNFFKKEKDNKI